MTFLKAHATEIIAICAMIITVYQAWLSRRHNRLSVRPRLSAQLEKSISPDYLELVLSLTNKGIGPALIEKSIFLLDKNSCEIDVSLKELFGDGIEILKHTSVSPGSVISVNESKIIFSIKSKNSMVSHQEFDNFIKNKTDRIGIYIAYKSMYEQRYVFDLINER
jgi:hypothetical protein